MANLLKRYWDLRNNVGGLPQTTPSQPDPHYGFRSIEGEQHQFNGRQQGLRNRLDKWNTDGCGDPPSGAWDWATREVPAADPKPLSDSTRQMVDTTVKVGATVSAGYIIYRVIRMIPSLFPPLWETIPANLAIP